MIDQWIEKLKSGKHLKLDELKQLVETSKEIFLEENNVQPVPAPVVICGDIHGQFYDLLQLFDIAGWPPDSKFIFMGDYVDRGYNSVETIQLLLCFKVKYPDRIILLRGNHESRQISHVYGFYQECYTKYGSADPWVMCTDLFDYMGIAALVNDRIFCIHAGLSPLVKTIDQIRVLDRIQEIPQDGAFCDLLWSDPEEVGTWGSSARGAGYVYGHKVAAQFNRLNNLELIARAHQLVQEGFCYMFPEKSVCTVWSAPNYCYRCGNLASVLCLNEQLEREFKIFREDPDKQKGPPNNVFKTFF